MSKQKFKTFQKDVTTSGTPVQIGSFTYEERASMVIKSKASNTGYIKIGGSSADAQKASSNNFTLDAAGDALDGIEVTDTNLIWIDAEFDGEGVEIVIG